MRECGWRTTAIFPHNNPCLLKLKPDIAIRPFILSQILSKLLNQEMNQGERQQGAQRQAKRLAWREEKRTG
jgi:hypothetical protein